MIFSNLDDAESLEKFKALEKEKALAAETSKGEHETAMKALRREHAAVPIAKRSHRTGTVAAGRGPPRRLQERRAIEIMRLDDSRDLAAAARRHATATSSAPRAESAGVASWRKAAKGGGTRIERAAEAVRQSPRRAVKTAQTSV